MSAIYQNGRRFYRRLPGVFHDPKYNYWVLWQPIVRKRFLLVGPYRWVNDGQPFWLDSDGFKPADSTVQP